MGTERNSAVDPARMVAEARRAFFTVFAFLCVIWLLQLANWLADNRIAYDFGIVAQDVERLPDVFAAPFLHLNWQHLEGNSGPLFVFGFLAAYRGVKKFLGLTLLVALSSGLTVWLFERDTAVTVGASGVVFGYFGYVVLRGLIDRNLIDSLIGVVMFASFAYILTTAVPGTPGVSWLGHLGGLVGGLAGAWIFRDRTDPTDRARRTDRSDRSNGSGRADGSGTAAVPTQGGAPVSPRAELLKELDDLGL
ncbi:rhomboid family intramembrane serine protease [Kitasatospora camelliae]|uniref:Rhomboid family intramembrane serine protease n=1 Tax=Kitasatospora camelliae TaxID=3156397 RepID=A0AAU8JWU9_9ACTN